MSAARPFTAAPKLAYFSSPDHLPAEVLGALIYGRDARVECAGNADPRLVGIPLESLRGAPRAEALLTRGPVTTGRHDGVRFARSEDHLFGVIEVDEHAFGGPHGAGLEAYRRLVKFQGQSTHPHVWRVWNFLDAINEGEGDDERYQQFCLGRAQGLGTGLGDYPAASAVGRRDGERILQVVWIAGRASAQTVENPRQTSAFRYPRQYGPASPSFSRAAWLGGLLLISGTASIVGHASMHDGDIQAQTAEAIANLRAVAGAAGLELASLTSLKAYVRHAKDVEAVAAVIAAHGFSAADCCFLLADICRRDLLVEFEAVGTG